MHSFVNPAFLLAHCNVSPTSSWPEIEFKVNLCVGLFLFLFFYYYYLYSCTFVIFLLPQMTFKTSHCTVFRSHGEVQKEIFGGGGSNHLVHDPASHYLLLIKTMPCPTKVSGTGIWLTHAHNRSIIWCMFAQKWGPAMSEGAFSQVICASWLGSKTQWRQWNCSEWSAYTIVALGTVVTAFAIHSGVLAQQNVSTLLSIKTL